MACLDGGVVSCLNNNNNNKDDFDVDIIYSLGELFETFILAHPME